MSRFEWLVAIRYLRTKRKQTVISVITVISVLGVAAGVAALLVALSINNGFQSALRDSLLSATAHVSIVERNPAYGIEHWQPIAESLGQLPGVLDVTPGLYGQVAIKGPLIGAGAILKGVPLGTVPHPPLGTVSGSRIPNLLQHLEAGSLHPLQAGSRPPSIILGSALARTLGVHPGNQVSILSYQGQLTPLGMMPALYRVNVAGTFSSGLYDLDSTWVFTDLSAAQHMLDLADVVNTIELRIEDIYAASTVARRAESLIGPKLIATTWMDQNRSLLNALRLEKIVSTLTVSLIELVAGLNILAVLVMAVLEKTRDIAILRSLGCRATQIRRIFALQGLIIGASGCLLGLAVGYALVLAGQHFRPIRLDQEVYALSYVPFEAHWSDGISVALLALLTSFLATLPPSISASRLQPAEILRSE